MELLSVIVPVYNVAKYLPECLDSILEQSYKNMEIILIDDGSTDSSGEICDEYAQRDIRIRVFHKENGGQASARNMGMEVATGTLITFVDSDDSIEQGMYQSMILSMNEHNTDIVACAFFNCEESKKTATGETNDCVILSTQEIFIHKNQVRFLVWNKIYRREVLAGILFQPGQIYEEVHFNRQVFLHAKNMVYIDTPYYNYRLSRPGNTNSQFKLARLCIFDEFDALQADLEKLNFDQAKRAMILYALEFYRRLYKEAYELHAGAEIRKQIRQNFKRYYDKAMQNNIMLDKGCVAFHIMPNLLSWRDIVKGKIQSR